MNMKISYLLLGTGSFIWDAYRYEDEYRNQDEPLSRQSGAILFNKMEKPEYVQFNSVMDLARGQRTESFYFLFMPMTWVTMI